MLSKNQELPSNIAKILKPRRDVTVSPNTENKEQEKASENSSTKSELLFQAVGVVTGKVEFIEDKTAFITISGNKYPLFYIPSRKGFKAFSFFQDHVKATGEQQRILVYPKAIHFPEREKQHQIAFQLVAFDSGKNDGAFSMKDFEFRLSGIWQFIPVCQVPCISVFKNFTEERVKFIKKIDATKKVKYMKASHIPLFWKDSPVPPFRFNPKLPKEQQRRPYFVSIVARFLPQKNAFGFVSLCQMPSEEMPKFLKAGKQMKAEALASNKNKTGKIAASAPKKELKLKAT